MPLQNQHVPPRGQGDTRANSLKKGQTKLESTRCSLCSQGQQARNKGQGRGGGAETDLHPGVLQGLLCSQAMFGIHHQQTSLH